MLRLAGKPSVLRGVVAIDQRMSSSSTSNTSVAFGGITPPAPRAPWQLRRDGQFADAANAHALNAFVPSGDHIALAERKIERLVAILARIELASVGQPTGVMNADKLAGGSAIAVAGLISSICRPDSVVVMDMIFL